MYEGEVRSLYFDQDTQIKKSDKQIYEADEESEVERH